MVHRVRHFTEGVWCEPNQGPIHTMENAEVEDLITELQVFSPKQLELVNPRMELTPGRRNLMSKYLSLNEEEPWPLLEEYFGVALAFAALGALIRGSNGKNVTTEVKFSAPKLQRMALQDMLSGTMERLHSLARNAQDLQEKLAKSRDARGRDRQHWEEEKVDLLLRVADAEAEVVGMRKRRDEDSKANEKVVRIYASQEQDWRREKKKLRREIDLLRKDLIKTEVGGFCRPRTSPQKFRCQNCELKEKYVNELEETLSEKEFLIMTAMEEAQSEEHELNELTTRLSIAEAHAAELSEKLANELTISANRELLVAQITADQQNTDSKLASVREELEITKSHLESLGLATDNHTATSEKLLSEMASLQQDVEDKEEVIATMLMRATIEREEKEDLAAELAQFKCNRNHAEGEVDRWSALVEERGRLDDGGRDSHRSGRRSFGSRSDFDRTGDGHAEKLEDLRPGYGRQIEALESQLRMYKEKMQESAEASTPSASAIWTSDFQEPLMDPAFKEWFEIAKGRVASQLEERHWYQIETFERQLRVKDERLKAFRSQLLAKDSELSDIKQEVEALKSKPHEAMAEKCTTLVTTDRKDKLIHPMHIARARGDSGEEDTVKAANSGVQQELVETLHIELMNYKKKLREQEDEHKANLMKMAENAEVQLAQKDVQLAMLEAKLCQVQLQFEKSNWSGDMVSSEDQDEKMFLEDIDDTHGKVQEPSLKRVLHSAFHGVAKLTDKITEGQRKTDLEEYNITSLEDLVDEANAVTEPARQLSKLKDMCLKEVKSPAMVIFHKNMELETSDNHQYAPKSLTAVQKTDGKSKKSGQAQESAFPTKPADIAFDKEPVAALQRTPSRSPSRKGTNVLSMRKKGRKSMNKQPYSPGLRSHRPSSENFVEGILLTQAPTKGTRPARVDKFHVLEDNHPQRTLFNEEDPLQDLPQRTLLNDAAASQAPPFPTAENHTRKETRTREDIQVLGLALEVRRIEQQLTQMNKSAAESQLLEGRAATRVAVSRKRSKRYAALAGRCSQLAKQIGLTGTEQSLQMNLYSRTARGGSEQDPFSSDLCLHKNPLFSQELPTSQLVLLQQRTESVRDNLSAIQAKSVNDSDSSSPVSNDSTSLFPKGQLVDTVQAHLSQVQRRLAVKLAHAIPELSPSKDYYRSSKSSCQVLSKGLNPDDFKPAVSISGKRDFRPAVHDAGISQGTRKARTQILLRRLEAELRR